MQEKIAGLTQNFKDDTKNAILNKISEYLSAYNFVSINQVLQSDF